MVPMVKTDEPIMNYSRGVKEADGYLHRRDLLPGTASVRTLEDGHTLFTWVCPCGCGAVSFVGIEISPDASKHEWGWDGDKEKPTLTPSLQQNSACRWHGFMTDGLFINA